MNTILISVVVFLLVVLAMSVGVIFTGKTISGSCGGLGKLFGKSACDLCEHKDNCEKA